MKPTTKQKLIRVGLWLALALVWTVVLVMRGIAAVAMILLGWVESIRDSIRERLGLEPTY